MYGALSDEVDVNSGDEAFRLVCILRKGDLTFRSIQTKRNASSPLFTSTSSLSAPYISAT
jgi:hypothetical protein